MISTLLLSVVLIRQEANAQPTPEAAFRAFLTAMLTGDEKTLRAVTLPNDDFAWLLKGKPLPKAQSAKIKEQIDKMVIKSLKVGDAYTLPGNRKMTVLAEEVGVDRAVLLPEGAPVPTRCRKVDGVWRIDAAPIISGRKAAEKTRKDTDNPGKKDNG